MQMCAEDINVENSTAVSAANEFAPTVCRKEKNIRIKENKDKQTVVKKLNKESVKLKSEIPIRETSLADIKIKLGFQIKQMEEFVEVTTVRGCTRYRFEF